MKIVITGGAGFIGSYLVSSLLDNGHEIKVIDNLSNPIALFRKYIDKVLFLQGDILNKLDIREAVRGADLVYHLAAETVTGKDSIYPVRYARINVEGTINLLQESIRAGVQKIILASSRAVYGEGLYKCSRCGIVHPNGRKNSILQQKEWRVSCPKCSHLLWDSIPINEDVGCQPISIYGTTKYTQELLVSQLCEKSGIKYNILRFQNVYGPHRGRVLDVFAECCKKGKKIEVYEEGTVSRDFIYITDAVEALVKSIKQDFRVLDIGSGISTSLVEVAQRIKNFFGSKSTILCGDKFRFTDVWKIYAGCLLSKKVMGFHPKISLAKGIELLCRYHKKI